MNVLKQTDRQKELESTRVRLFMVFLSGVFHYEDIEYIHTKLRPLSTLQRFMFMREDRTKSTDSKLMVCTCKTLAHLLTNSLTFKYSLTHLLTYSLTHLLTYSLTHLLTYSLSHSRRRTTLLEGSIVFEYSFEIMFNGSIFMSTARSAKIKRK